MALSHFLIAPRQGSVSGPRLARAMQNMVKAPEMTLEEFLALPETEPASEYYCGEVSRKPLPIEDHSVWQMVLLDLLRDFLRRNPIGRVRIEWWCIFGPPGLSRPLVARCCACDE